MKKIIVVLLASTMCSLIALNVAAQRKEPTPEDIAKKAVEVRQSVKKLVNWNNAVFGDMMRKKRPFDAAAVELSAKRIAELAAMMPDAFAHDTSEFDNLETIALDGIWKSKDDFDSKANNLGDRATALAELAAAGDEKAIVAALRKFGRDTCGDCHDAYRHKN